MICGNCGNDVDVTGDGQCPACEADMGAWDRMIDCASAEIDALSPEARTLFLARAGISPLDMEADARRALEMISSYEAERKRGGTP